MTNPQLQLAQDYVCHTNKHIFLTGKAGTGKTTFLQQIRLQANKRLAVVAPTGVAAINAQGVTIHSLFQLPFGTLIPGQLHNRLNNRRFSKKKIKLIKSLDLLVIDEISMVRADVLDAIDEVLRRYRDFSKTFGGVQVLMIGDLHQLPPVVKQQEWDLMRQHYNTPYFFGSQVLQKTDVVTIELQHIYRQSDKEFIHLLNKVRTNQTDEQLLKKLNSRFQIDFQPEDSEGYITLTSHNAVANKINTAKLNQLTTNKHLFNAKIANDFPAHAFPTTEQLEFKVGAQVMFVRNDSSPDKLYYNGKIGRIVDIEDNKVRVECPGDQNHIEVFPTEWQNKKYDLNEKTKEVEEKIIGTFTQLPLKLAWAITIHKSQGLTFEKVIIDAQAAFAHGQVYVALSRCKSFESIVLRSKIVDSSVHTDKVIQNFTAQVQQKQPNAAQLHEAKHSYQQDLLRELFSFKNLKLITDQIRRLVLENDQSLQGTIEPETADLKKKGKDTVINFAEKFIPHLNSYFNSEALPENNQTLQQRLQKASAYFSQQLKDVLLPIANNLQVITDNTFLEKKLKEKIHELKKTLHISIASFEACKEEFSPSTLTKTRIDAELDFQSKPTKSKPPSKTPKDIEHLELYELLADWRAKLATTKDVARYQILPTRTLLEIAEVRPTSATALKRISGIGKVRVEEFGADIIHIVTEYCYEHQLATDQLQLATGKKPKPTKPPKPDTKLVSLDLYKSGKNIAEIAKERSLATSTIESHMAHFIGEGTITVFDFVDKQKVERISTYFKNADNKSFNKALQSLGTGYNYSDLRMVLAHINQQEEKDKTEK